MPELPLCPRLHVEGVVRNLDVDQLISELDALGSMAAGAAFLAERAEDEVEVRQQVQPAIRAIIEHVAKRLNELARRIDDGRS